MVLRTNADHRVKVLQHRNPNTVSGREIASKFGSVLLELPYFHVPRMDKMHNLLVQKVSLTDYTLLMQIRITHARRPKRG
jgi:hypothetical protein